MGLGNIVLLILTVFIFQRRGFSALDLAYWLVIAGMILVRYIDITKLRGLTKDGEPATLGHWRRYALFLPLIVGGVWVLAHLVGR
jgi:hypothetical protein